MDWLSSSSASYFLLLPHHETTNLMWTINRLSLRCVFSLLCLNFYHSGWWYWRNSISPYQFWWILSDVSDRIVHDADIERPLLIPMNGILCLELHETLEKLSPCECGAPSMFWRVLHFCPIFGGTEIRFSHVCRWKHVVVRICGYADMRIQQNESLRYSPDFR